MNDIEIMAPAGNFECLQAAIKAGAGSVYFGVKQLNMRARAANNFELSDLKEIVEICRENDVKSYLAVNVVVYDSELELVREICDAALDVGVSAIIATDFSVIQYARSIGLHVHASVQANVSNIEAVKFFSQYCDVIVLARELNLEQVRELCRVVKEEGIKGPSGDLVKIEVFVHGALCVSVSGKCYMSLATYAHSANRGDCLQNCRRKYKVVDDETGDELIVENGYVMSPKDLCCINIIDKLIETGVSVFKIEGRGRKAEYVNEVVRCYNEAVKSVENREFSDKKIDEWVERLKRVYNRGFWMGGYYLGKKMGEWCGVYGSKATTTKKYIGKCLNYYAKKNIALFKIESGELSVGDNLIITGPTTGVVELIVGKFMVDDKFVESAKKGGEVTIELKEKIRVNDKLFVIRKN